MEDKSGKSSVLKRSALDVRSNEGSANIAKSVKSLSLADGAKYLNGSLISNFQYWFINFVETKSNLIEDIINDIVLSELRWTYEMNQPRTVFVLGGL